MLEGELLVPELEPPPAVHAYGAAFVLGLDVLERFDATFSNWSGSLADGLENPPTISLTPGGGGSG